MSGTVVVVIIPAAIVIAGVGIVLGTGLVVSRLHQEYQEAKEAFDARSQAEMQARLVTLRLHQQHADEVSKVVQQAIVHPQVDASYMMIRHGIERLIDTATNLKPCPPELLKRCQVLYEQLESQAKSSTVIFSEYSQLSTEVTELQRKSRTTTAQITHSIVDELELLRSEVMEGLPDEREWKRMRTTFLSRISALDRLASTQPASAQQGMLLLRQHVHRELKSCIESYEFRKVEAERMRTQTTDILAKLQSIYSHQELPTYSEKALMLLKRLGALLASPQNECTDQLLSINCEVDALFEECNQAVNSKDVGEMVSRQVQDALLSLGYRVTVMPLEQQESTHLPTFVTAVTPDVGVEFSVDAEGRMKTEMVSLSSNVETVQAVTQEKVCDLIDRVFTTLRERQIQVREKCRRTMKDGHALRKISVRKADNQQQNAQQGKDIRHSRGEVG